MLNEIHTTKILETAMRLAGSANLSIQMTMQAEEEKQSPLPEEYFTLLINRMKAGVQITRIGFVNEKDFVSLELQTQVDSPNYRFVLAPLLPTIAACCL